MIRRCSHCKEPFSSRIPRDLCDECLTVLVEKISKGLAPKVSADNTKPL